MITIRKINKRHYTATRDRYTLSHFFINKVDTRRYTLSIFSSFINSTYVFWCPESIEKTLTEMSFEELMYLMSEKELDLDSTIKNLKHWVIYQRKNDRCTKEQALRAWRDIKRIDDFFVKNDWYLLGLFEAFMPEFEDINRDFRYEFNYLIAYKWSDSDKYFMDNILTAFVDFLKNELARGEGSEKVRSV